MSETQEAKPRSFAEECRAEYIACGDRDLSPFITPLYNYICNCFREENSCTIGFTYETSKMAFGKYLDCRLFDSPRFRGAVERQCRAWGFTVESGHRALIKLK